MLVLDASVTIAALCPDEHNRECIELLDAAVLTDAAVPALWAAEVCNILEVKHRQNKIDRSDIDRIQELLRSFETWIETGNLLGTIFAASNLANKHNLSVYDAIYLELAMRRQLPLATLDKKLAAAAINCGIEVLPPAA